MENIITIKNVSRTFNDKVRNNTQALADIDLTVKRGEFLMLLGPSGSGKSTLLRILCGLDTQTHGSIEFAPDVSCKDMAFVFQQFALLPWLTVAENIGLGLLAKGVPDAERESIVERELEVFGLRKFAHSPTRELSGGMKQRVGIARALAVDPKILLADEPFSELDSFTAEELRQEMLHIWRERKLTVIMVSHLVPEAIELADRIAVFTPRPGRIEKIVVNSLPRPRQMRSRDFFTLEDHLAQIIRP